MVLNQKRELLKALSPERWLQRGLVMVRDADNSAISSARSVKGGDRLELQFHDGIIQARAEAATKTTTKNQ